MDTRTQTRDLDGLREMLDRAGIVYEVELTNDPNLESREYVLTVTAKKGENNVGYPYFVSELHFDAEGRLLRWGCWE